MIAFTDIGKLQFNPAKLKEMLEDVAHSETTKDILRGAVSQLHLSGILTVAQEVETVVAPPCMATAIPGTDTTVLVSAPAALAPSDAAIAAPAQSPPPVGALPPTPGHEHSPTHIAGNAE